MLDLVAREEPRQEWAEPAQRYGARFGVIECLCSDEMIHCSRIEGRDRGIPAEDNNAWSKSSSSVTANSTLAQAAGRRSLKVVPWGGAGRPVSLGWIATHWSHVYLSRRMRLIGCG
jgi:hypothetical protein